MSLVQISTFDYFIQINRMAEAVRILAEVAPISNESNARLKVACAIADDLLSTAKTQISTWQIRKKDVTRSLFPASTSPTSHALFRIIGTRHHHQIMQDDLILLVLTIKIFCPALICLPSSLSAIFGACLDWSVLIAAYRLAAIISALVN